MTLISILHPNLGKIPVIQSDHGSDVVFQQMVNQLTVVLDSSFIDMVGCRL